jgi:hypothetical protein
MTRKTFLLWLAAGGALLLLLGLGWLIIPALNRGHLLIETKVSPDASAPQAAIKSTFYLLDTDMMTLAAAGDKNGDLREKVFRENPQLENLAGIMNARRRAAYSLGPDVVPFIEQSRPLWEPHVIQSVEADSTGGARFQDLKPGDYWLMGRRDWSDGVDFWNMRVTVKRGENRLMLDKTNALQCSSCK